MATFLRKAAYVVGDILAVGGVLAVLLFLIFLTLGAMVDEGLSVEVAAPAFACLGGVLSAVGIFICGTMVAIDLFDDD